MVDYNDNGEISIAFVSGLSTIWISRVGLFLMGLCPKVPWLDKPDVLKL